MDSLKGQIDEVKLIKVGVVSPGRRLMRELKVGSFDKVIRVQKAFYMGKDVVQYSNIYLPYQKGNPIVEDVINFANFHGIMEKS